MFRQVVQKKRSQRFLKLCEGIPGNPSLESSGAAPARRSLIYCAIDPAVSLGKG